MGATVHAAVKNYLRVIPQRVIASERLAPADPGSPTSMGSLIVHGDLAAQANFRGDHFEDLGKCVVVIEGRGQARTWITDLGPAKPGQPAFGRLSRRHPNQPVKFDVGFVLEPDAYARAHLALLVRPGETEIYFGLETPLRADLAEYPISLVDFSTDLLLAERIPAGEAR